MAVLIPFAIAIATSVATIATVIATVVAAVVATVGSVLAVIGTGLSIAVTAIVSGAISGIVFLSAQIVSGITYTYSVIAPVLSTVWTAVKTYSVAIYGYMKAFLEYIHFTTILKIHNIAMLVSSDYRQMMKKVYGEIAKFSESIGLGAHFINLAMNDARTLVLDVSSLMGRSYDLGQVQWLKTMNDHLKHIQRYAEHYQQEPMTVLTDLAELIDKPAMDAKAGFMRSFISIVDGAVTVANNTAEKAITLRQDIDQAILHLPKQISEPIYEAINPHLERFDAFMEDEFKPVAENLENAILILSDTTKRQTDKLGSLTDKILNPGDLLSGVDDLTELERIRQEGKIAEIANRAPLREVVELNKGIDTVHQGLKNVYKAITEIREKPPYHVEEARGLTYPPGQIPALYKSWFVGDF